MNHFVDFLCVVLEGGGVDCDRQGVEGQYGLNGVVLLQELLVEDAALVGILALDELGHHLVVCPHILPLEASHLLPK